MKSSSSVKKYNILQPLMISCLVALGMFIGISMQPGNSSRLLEYNKAVNANKGVRGDIGRVEELIRFVESKYVSEIEEDALLESALHGILSSLDPHSVYIPPDELASLKERMEGTYKGLGIETLLFKDTVIIIKVIKSSPAAAAGLKKFDKIISINGDNIKRRKMTNENLSSYLNHDDNDQISLTIQSHLSSKIRTINIPKGDVIIPSVDISYMLTDSIAYIKLKNFSSKVYKEFMAKVEEFAVEREKIHLIIDVRDNPGGYLPETTNILSQLFKDKDKLLVFTEGKNDEKTEYTTTGKPFFDIDKIVVLVNEGSASGSEIIAGAIQDWDRGVIIGRPSFGKGLVQEQFDLSNGGALRLTVAKYFTPSGRCIQKPHQNESNLLALENDSTTFFTKLLNRKIYGGGGIKPDIELPITEEFLYYIEDTMWTKYIPEFSVVTILGNQQSDNLNSIESFIEYLDNANLDQAFSSYLMQEYNIEMPNQYLKDNSLSQLIAHKAIEYKYGNEVAQKHYNQSDRYIAEAILVINRKEQFAAK